MLLCLLKPRGTAGFKAGLEQVMKVFGKIVVEPSASGKLDIMGSICQKTPPGVAILQLEGKRSPSSPVTGRPVP
jgi:hypothetical protein